MSAKVLTAAKAQEAGQGNLFDQPTDGVPSNLPAHDVPGGITPAAFAPLPIRSGQGEGSRADFPDDNGGEFGVGVSSDPRDRDDVRRAVAKLRRTMSFDPDQQPEQSEDKPEWLQRQEQLHDQFGFWATSSQEIADAHTVSRYLGTPRGVAGYLNTVMQESRRRNVKRASAIIPAKADQMGAFYIDAVERHVRTESLGSQLCDLDPNLMADEAADQLLTPAIIDLQQHAALYRAVDRADRDPLKATLGKQKATHGIRLVLKTMFEVPEDGAQLLIAEQQAIDDLRNYTVRELTGLANDTSNNHAHRIEFWRASLLDARRHALAEKTVDKILGNGLSA
jgi:hypothetical protein